MIKDGDIYCERMVVGLLLTGDLVLLRHRQGVAQLRGPAQAGVRPAILDEEALVFFNLAVFPGRLVARLSAPLSFKSPHCTRGKGSSYDDWSWALFRRLC